MDINLLLQQHQIARMQADQALEPCARAELADIAGDYGAQITRWRQSIGLPATGWPYDERHAAEGMA